MQVTDLAETITVEKYLVRVLRGMELPEEEKVMETEMMRGPEKRSIIILLRGIHLRIRVRMMGDRQLMREGMRRMIPMRLSARYAFFSPFFFFDKC